MKSETNNKTKIVAKHVQKIIDAQDLRNTKYYNWVKNIVTLAIGFLGIIVSLKSDEIQNFYQYLFFVITISSLAMGILAGVMILYSEVDFLNKRKRFEKENLLRILDDKKIIKVKEIERTKIFDISEYIFIISFVVSTISVVIYSTLSDYKTAEKSQKTKISIIKH